MIRNTSAPTPSDSLDNVLKMTDPKPASGFRQVLGALAGGVGNVIFPGLGTAIGGAIGGGVLGAAMPTLGGETTQYLQLQRQIQQESLAFETASTVMKVRHDAAHEAISNMK